ncbi:putative ATP-grasp-modified RiPP [Streptomyces sp. DH12]|uniref:putative ATP-grasp-modified RiPP n=1 Tax=Streptomyces sp. DH12 TaxID=2857010 RepID=UPI001E4DAA9F|nr:putative ATP-grasp-modified RiPP [Streptomyces sp. DH12]
MGRPFALRYAVPAGAGAGTPPPYAYDAARQLNVLPDGRPAVADPEVLRAAGTTTSTAGSQTHFDD